MNASKLSVNNTPVINGTAGRIFFQGSTNVLQQSANLFWDDANLRLGINGTPTSSLEIFYNPTGISNTIGLTLNSGSTGSTLKAIRFTAGTFGELGTFGVNTGSGEFRWATSASYFPTIYSNGAERLRIATTGNVLINTTTDAGFKLDVNGSVRLAGGSGNDIISDTNVTINGYAGGGSVIRFQSRNAASTLLYKFVIPNSTDTAGYFTGNVGIGTASPLFTLDVNGSARVSGNATITSADVANPDVGPPAFNIFNGTFSKFNVVYNAAGCRVNMLGTSTQGLQINTGSSNNITSIGGGGITISCGTNNFQIISASVLFNVAGSERARFAASTGNLLINTTTDAGYRLDVNGTARFIGRIDAGSFTPGSGASAYTIATTGRISAGNGISFRSPIFGDSIFVGFVPASNHEQIQVFTSGNNALIFGGSGNNPASMVFANPNFNPITGTADKSIFAVGGIYQTSGTYSGIIRGFYYNPNLVSMTGVTAHYAWHSTSGRFKIEGLPTSPTGLTAGELWNNGGVINIV